MSTPVILPTEVRLRVILVLLIAMVSFGAVIRDLLLPASGPDANALRQALSDILPSLLIWVVAVLVPSSLIIFRLVQSGTEQPATVEPVGSFGQSTQAESPIDYRKVTGIRLNKPDRRG